MDERGASPRSKAGLVLESARQSWSIVGSGVLRGGDTAGIGYSWQSGQCGALSYRVRVSRQSSPINSILVTVRIVPAVSDRIGESRPV